MVWFFVILIWFIFNRFIASWSQIIYFYYTKTVAAKAAVVAVEEDEDDWENGGVAGITLEGKKGEREKKI